MKSDLLFRFLTYSLTLAALPFVSACHGSFSSNPVADYSAYGAATGPADTKTPPDKLLLEDVDCNNMFTIATSTDQSTLTFRENQSSTYKITVTSLYDADFEVIPYNLPCAECFKVDRRNGKIAIYNLTWNPGKLPPQQITTQTLSLEYRSQRTDKRCVNGQRRQLEIQIESANQSGAESPNPALSASASQTPAAAKPTTDVPNLTGAGNKPTLAFVLSSFPQKPLILGKDHSFEFEVLLNDASFTKDIQPRAVWSAPTAMSTVNSGKKLFDASGAIDCISAAQDKTKTRFIGSGQWQVTCKLTLAKVRGVVAAAKNVKVLELGFVGKVGKSEDVASPIFSAQGGK